MTFFSLRTGTKIQKKIKSFLLIPVDPAFSTGGQTNFRIQIALDWIN
jgi:hypothetical protein